MQFERVHAADELLAHLLDQRRIPGEAFGIETAHLIDQSPQLLASFRAILRYRSNAVEKV